MGLLHLHYTDCFGTNELCIDGFIADIAHLLLGHKDFGEGAHREGLAIDDPEVAEITEGDGSCTCAFRRRRHVVGDVHRLAE